jgi:hypothetical protein
VSRAGKTLRTHPPNLHNLQIKKLRHCQVRGLLIAAAIMVAHSLLPHQAETRKGVDKQKLVFANKV